MSPLKRTCGAALDELYEDGEDTHRCGLDFDHDPAELHQCRTCGGRWWAGESRVVPVDPAFAALVAAGRAMVEAYQAACPDWWPGEIDDLEQALDRIFPGIDP